jgi:hypothetical protein
MNANAIPQGHSPLGASGAYQWMACPGSVQLSEGVEDTESDFAVLGTAAHALAALCLEKNREAWEYVGDTVDSNGLVTQRGTPLTEEEEAASTPIDKNMADAVQVYLDAVRRWHPDRNQGNSWVERRFYCPTIHPLFYGTADFLYLDVAARTLHVWDYKHGAGIVVEAGGEAGPNPQLAYYASGALETLGLWDDVDTVVLRIAQPRGWHYAGPIRHYEMPVSDLVAWLEDTLVPAMVRTETSTEVKSGEHCRFCPARLTACPAIAKDMDDLEALMTAPAEELTPEQAGRFLSLFNQAKIYNKAAEHIAFGMMQAGRQVPGWKLAESRTNRDWRDPDKAAAEAIKVFGKDCMTQPELKSPAQIEALPLGKDFTARHAYKPPGKLTVVKGTDTRQAVNKDIKSMFKKQEKK